MFKDLTSSKSICQSGLTSSCSQKQWGGGQLQPNKFRNAIQETFLGESHGTFAFKSQLPVLLEPTWLYALHTGHLANTASQEAVAGTVRPKPCSSTPGSPTLPTQMVLWGLCEPKCKTRHLFLECMVSLHQPHPPRLRGLLGTGFLEPYLSWTDISPANASASTRTRLQEEGRLQVKPRPQHGQRSPTRTTPPGGPRSGMSVMCFPRGCIHQSCFSIEWPQSEK